MLAARAERDASASPQQAAAAARWEALDRRQKADLILPGAVIGLIAGIVGGLITAMIDQPWDVALVSGVTLGLPLIAGGIVYEVLLCAGRIPLGPLAPAAMVWMVFFPLGRIIQGVITDTYAGASVEVPHGWTAFLVYQVLVAVAFAIGFWWLHENFAPRWWFYIRNRNPVADHFVRVQLDYARAAETEKAARRQRRAERAGRAPVAPAGRMRPRDRERMRRRAG
jgi:hypothetical protein